jgi:hypothetical protein
MDAVDFISRYVFKPDAMDVAQMDRRSWSMMD